MKKILIPVIILFSASLFTFLFYKQSFGINLLLFELIIIAIILFVQKDKLQSVYARFICAATVISGASVVINYTTFAIVINILSFFILTGVLIYPRAKSLMTSLELSFSNTVLSLQKFFDDMGEMKTAGISFRTIAHRLKILVIPFVIVGLFLTIYNVSSPFFNNAFADAMTKINDLLKKVDFNLVLVFTSGILCSIYPLVRVPLPVSIDKDKNASLLMLRMRKRVRLANPFALKREVISAKFLLIVLNLLLFVVNALDIWYVWFNFTWNGFYLKQFVHEGTYLLILSILISIGIVLYFFRGNVNFYKRSGILKKLAMLWMIQNAVLAVSVGIRNYWYIEYFALAYKRIGVIFFLLLTLYGIYTVIMKIRNRHSAFYLFRNNSMALFVVLLFMSLFNWDTIIAKYNFSHYQTSFVHYDFLSSLPAKTLPYLDKTREELAVIDSYQQKQFRFGVKYMTSDEYFEKIDRKKNLFKEKWESKKLLSWNYAEYSAYKNLTGSF